MHTPWPIKKINDQHRQSDMQSHDWCRSSTTKVDWLMPLAVGQLFLPKAQRPWLMLHTLVRHWCHPTDVHTPWIMRTDLGWCCNHWLMSLADAHLLRTMIPVVERRQCRLVDVHLPRKIYVGFWLMRLVVYRRLLLDAHISLLMCGRLNVLGSI